MKNKKALGFLLALLCGALIWVGATQLYKSLGQNVGREPSLATKAVASVGTSVGTSGGTSGEAKVGETSGASKEARETAPDLEVSGPNGTKFKLSDARGKVVVLNFWASWCPPCKAEFPDFQKYYEREKNNPKLQFALVNLVASNGETKADADAFIKDNGYTLPYYYDEGLVAAASYKIRSIPMTVIIDAEGGIVLRHIGTLSQEELDKAVQKAGR